MPDKVRVTLSLEIPTKERLALFAESNGWTPSQAGSWLIERGMKEFVGPTDLLKETAARAPRRGKHGRPMAE